MVSKVERSSKEVYKNFKSSRWEGVMDGVTGLFPGNYVEPCV
jgi:hypothetical protein